MYDPQSDDEDDDDMEDYILFHYPLVIGLWDKYWKKGRDNRYYRTSANSTFPYMQGTSN